MGFPERFGRALLRGLGWLLVAAVTLVAAALTFVPLSFLPGDFQTDFVNGHWIKTVGVLYVLAVLTWRMSPLTGGQALNVRNAINFLRLSITATILAFWPLALLIWFNAYGEHEIRTHDMRVTGIESTRIPPAVTPIRTFSLHELGTGWTADLQVTEEREHFAKVGSCVRIDVRQGRIGLDWISDARPIPCDDGAKG
jgi:hypothetical protein